MTLPSSPWQPWSSGLRGDRQSGTGPRGVSKHQAEWAPSARPLSADALSDRASALGTRGRGLLVAVGQRTDRNLGVNP
eukprot:CAMPEP_0174374486 /NCGR_PEP_ID=MMETSP0811_2-20130205/111096_1 /TAXON_ID=73025 ORGANISM="Eutreptiella gymnastica-like, Strain CCMP1594" /NCGR_SAMPLE_ID=MMETSP0811_2 /ASSEMBLY_ACC=CAM_ASM_000667 /LENGTH=77 /DNA_ID=CAMNT_0015523845 /DNA_START=51 /DNA_END=281 /DNA_ORIENTATION=-